MTEELQVLKAKLSKAAAAARKASAAHNNAFAELRKALSRSLLENLNFDSATRPKIVADSITLDAYRDYEAAYDEMFGSYKNVFNADLNTLIKRNREDE